MQDRINQMRAFIDKEFENESKSRLEFNDQHYRYLPSNLKYLLEEPPVRYDIYPKFFDEKQEQKDIL